MKRDQDKTEAILKEAETKLFDIETQRKTLRAELDAQLRREWEVKARLEIDRQVELETDRLRRLFETEVNKRVAIELEQDPNHSEKPRSLTPSLDDDRSTVHSTTTATSHSTVGSDSEFPSQTDISSLSLDSPFTSKPQKPLLKSTRTPLVRAYTIANYAASPADVQMVDPSPMSIASLALSPRKDSKGQKPSRLRPNIFSTGDAALEQVNESPACHSPIASDFDEYATNSGDDEELENFLALPSPTRDPFKPRGLQTKKMVRGEANAARLANIPNQFSSKTNPALASNTGISMNIKRPVSAVPVVTTSPSRKTMPSPGLRAKTAIGAARVPAITENGSPLKRTSSRESGVQLKQGNAGMLRAAVRNQLHGRTLVELAQARAGGDREKAPMAPYSRVAVKITEEDVPIWDPEQDEMPSPFLQRGRMVRSALR